MSHIVRRETLVFCTALVAFSGACGGGDSTGPSGPATLEIVSGNNQNTIRGDFIENPLRVIARDAKGSPLAGVTVQWAVITGQATLEPAQSTTNAAGEAETRVTLVKTLGDVLIAASAAPAPAVTFRVGSGDPCNRLLSWAISLEHAVTGELNSYDCEVQGNGRFWDLYFFTIPSQQAVTLHTRAPGFDARTELFTFDDGKGRAVKIDSIATVDAAVVKAILPPGNYSTGVSSYAVGAAGPYELLVSGALPSAASCDEEIWILRGVTTEQQLASTDCVDEAGPRYQDRFSIFLWQGERVAVAETSTHFAPHLRLTLRSGEVVAEADGGATGTATINFTVDVVAAWYIVVASSALAQQSGAYTLAVNAPPAGSQSVSSRSVGPGPRRSLVPMPLP